MELTWFHGVLGDPGSFYFVALVFVALVMSQLRLASLQLSHQHSTCRKEEREEGWQFQEVAHTSFAYIPLPTV